MTSVPPSAYFHHSIIAGNKSFATDVYAYFQVCYYMDFRIILTVEILIKVM